VPGIYTVRMTKGAQTYETKINVELDRRAPFTVADRQAQFDAVMKVHGMFGEMSDLVARIQAVRAGAASAIATLPANDPLSVQLAALSDKADAIRKQIVATKEGGAITGEQRLREHMDDLYGGLLGYEGRPAATLVDYTAVLKRELDGIGAEFAQLKEKDLGPANAALKARELPEIALPEHAPLAWRFSGNPDQQAAERD